MSLNENQLNNRVQWVKDLLSNEFEQGIGKLKPTYDGHSYYCCLGVACERVAPDKMFGFVGNAALMFGFGGNMALAFMHDDVADGEFGLSYDDQNVASSWNDKRKYSFVRIADLVAYATSHELDFRDSHPDDIAEGFAVEWLKQFS